MMKIQDSHLAASWTALKTTDFQEFSEISPADQLLWMCEFGTIVRSSFCDRSQNVPEIEIALRKHQLPHEFNPAAVKEAEAYPRLVQPEDYKGRIDLRELPLITIDGETARDFDDAVFCEPQGKGWRLVVAIADVSFYVKPGDALDKDAYERGNSVYFPRRVIPMLPEALSNGLCSLNPDVERLCMVCDMQVDGLGNVKRYQFYPSVMRSKARMTYTKVYEILSNPEGELAKEYAWLVPHLNHLNAFFKLSLILREKRGAIEFDSQETLMVFNRSERAHV